MAKAVLTSADIDLLKEVFATKDDLSSMEKRQDARFATKDDLLAFGGDLKEFTKNEMQEGIANIVRILTQEIKLEETLNDHERRIKQIEDITPGLPS